MNETIFFFGEIGCVNLDHSLQVLAWDKQITTCGCVSISYRKKSQDKLIIICKL